MVGALSRSLKAPPHQTLQKNSLILSPLPQAQLPFDRPPLPDQLKPPARYLLAQYPQGIFLAEIGVSLGELASEQDTFQPDSL